jgi:hypothetical protein
METGLTIEWSRKESEASKLYRVTEGSASFFSKFQFFFFLGIQMETQETLGRIKELIASGNLFEQFEEEELLQELYR